MVSRAGRGVVPEPEERHDLKHGASAINKKFLDCVGPCGTWFGTLKRGFKVQVEAKSQLSKSIFDLLMYYFS
jgi:hypothetical protein